MTYESTLRDKIKKLIREKKIELTRLAYYKWLISIGISKRMAEKEADYLHFSERELTPEEIETMNEFKTAFQALGETV